MVAIATVDSLDIIKDRILELNSLRKLILDGKFSELSRTEKEDILTKFGEVNKSLNGDIFDDDTIFIQQELSKDTLGKLCNFFTTEL